MGIPENEAGVIYWELGTTVRRALQPDVWYCESGNLMLFRPCNSRRPR